MHFTKLFSSITDSSVWAEDHATRIVWVTMLAMADREGRVHAALPGLARRAVVTLEEAERAIGRLTAPDPYSRSREHDGRRIVEVDGGWQILNHAKYARLLSDEDTKRRKREWWEKNRARPLDAKTSSGESSPSSKRLVSGSLDANSTHSTHVDAEVEVDAEVDAEGVRGRPRQAAQSKPQEMPPLDLVIADSERPVAELSAPQTGEAQSKPSKPNRKPRVPKPPKPKPERFVPQDWQPNETHREKAREFGVLLHIEVQRFRCYEFKTPKTDWNRAFHGWLARAGQFATSSGYRPAMPTGESREAQEARKAMEFLRNGTVTAEVV